MTLAALRRYRRLLSAAVSLSAIALVMAKVGASAEQGSGVGLIASFALIVSLVLLVIVWRKEHAENEAAFDERLKLQLLLAKKDFNRDRTARDGSRVRDR